LRQIFWPLSIILFFGLHSCQAYRAAMISDEGIYYYQRVKIGGIRQSVMIRGQDKSNPVMLFLHGGPGFPMFPVDQATKTMQRMEEDFTMVYWEQRGTGGSFSWRLRNESMTVDDFVDDTREVVSLVKELLDAEKVFIWGHSWGSIVGALFAARYPEMLCAYVSTGQSVNPFQNERFNYDFVLENALEDINRRALRDLERVDTIPERYTLRDALQLRRWVYYYGGVVKKAERSGRYIDFDYVVNTLSAPEYGVLDRLNMLLMPYFSAEELWDDLMHIDLTIKAPRIEVPVFFLLGRHDIIVSSKLAADYFDKLKAPAGKELFWFEHSAHRPHHEEHDKFLHLIRTKVLPLAEH